LGEIILHNPDRVVGKYNDVQVILLTHQWRAVQEKQDGLIVIINSCGKYFISDLTMKEFHHINDNDETVKKKFEYLHEKLVCQICHGVGKLDWIENARKHTHYKFGTYTNYVRNPETPIRLLDDYYVSSPILEEGQKLCKTCCGTGLHMFNENAYLEMLESENKIRNAERS